MHTPPPAYSTDELLAMERFHAGLDVSVLELLETHVALPREVRYVADIQRWIISQMTLALHFEHRLDAARDPISPRNLVRALEESGVASRNTIHAFLLQMGRYGFTARLPSSDRRQHCAEATEMSEQLIRRYFDIHLRALDVVDGGDRYALFCRHPDILGLAQPRFARLLVAQRDWYRPPESIASFTRSDSGTSVLHDLVAGAPPVLPEKAARIWIGKVSSHAFAQRYSISRTHVARLFGFAREAGLLGWAEKNNRGECWISSDLVLDYRRWQAAKLAAVSRAFHEACLALAAQETEPAAGAGNR